MGIFSFFKNLREKEMEEKYKNLIERNMKNVQFKDSRVEAIYNTVKAHGMEKEFLSGITKALKTMCDQLIDVIRIENGELTKPTTNVKGWKKDGNLLTWIENENGEFMVSAALCNEKCKKYVSSVLGYELKTVPYTYDVSKIWEKNGLANPNPNGFESFAIVLE